MIVAATVCDATNEPEPCDSRPHPGLAGVPASGLVLAGIWFVFVTIEFSNAGIDLLVFLGAVFGSLLWGLIWLVRIVLMHAKTPSTGSLRQLLLYWGFEPAVFAFSILLLAMDAPANARFLLSRAALDTYAENVIAKRTEPQDFGSPIRRVGLYSIYETELLPGDIVRVITSRDGFNDAGFAFSPDTTPPKTSLDSYRSLNAGWWHWSRIW